MQSKNPIETEVLNEQNFLRVLHKHLLMIPEIVTFNPTQERLHDSLMKQVTDSVDVEKPNEQPLFSIMEQYISHLGTLSFVPETDINTLNILVQHALNGCAFLSELNSAHRVPSRTFPDYKSFSLWEDAMRDELYTVEAIKLETCSFISQLLKTFPKYAAPLFSNVVTNERGFQKVFSLEKILPYSSEYFLMAIKILIANPLQYQYIIDSSDKYLSLIGKLMECDKTLVLLLSLDKIEFKRLVVNSNAFIAIMKALPYERQHLMAMLLSDEFERLVPNIETLFRLINALPQFEQEIMNYIPFAGIQYKRLVPYWSVFLKLVEIDVGLVDDLMSNEDEFQRLIDIKSKDSLKSAYKNKYFKQFRPQLLERAFAEGCLTGLNDLPRELLMDFIKKLDLLYDNFDYSLDPPVTHHGSTSFLWEKQVKMSALYAIFGKNIFNFLKSRLVSSPIPIEKYFDAIPLFNTIEINYYSNLIKNFYSQISKKGIDQLSNFFARISEWDDYNKEQLHIILNTKFFKKPAELLTFLYNYCLNKLLTDIGINIDELKSNELKEIMEKLPIDKFILLLQGYQSYSNESTQRLMRETLKAYLDPACSFEHFAYSTMNNTPFGTAVAQHNSRLGKALKLKNINTELLSDYPYTKTISYGENPDQAYFAQCKELLDFLSSLEKISPSSHKLINAIQNFQIQLLKGIKGSVQDQDREMFKRMQQTPYINLLKIIAKNLTSLASMPNPTKTEMHLDSAITSDLSIDPDLHGAALKKLQAFIIVLEKSQPVSTTKKSGFKQFQIRQWDKNNFDSLFLGNFLSCCLATNGGMFVALFMRLIDFGCSMIVINNEKNEPICGNWLSLVFDEDNPEDCYVVANFVEIRLNYTHDSELRYFLYDSLCNFTKQFADKIGAKGHILKKMDYGSLRHMNHLPSVNMCIQKIGDFFNPRTLFTEEKFSSKLFLHALEDDSFYQAKPVPLDYSLTLKKRENSASTNVIKTLGFFTQNKTENAADLSEEASSFQVHK